jgi:hypothetical protein
MFHGVDGSRVDGLIFFLKVNLGTKRLYHQKIKKSSPTLFRS